MKRKIWISWLLVLVLMLSCIQMASAATYDAEIVVKAQVSDLIPNEYSDPSAFDSVKEYNRSATVTIISVTKKTSIGTLSTSYTKTLNSSKAPTHGNITLDMSNSIGLQGLGSAVLIFNSTGTYTGYQLYRGNFALEQIPLTVNVIKSDYFAINSMFTAAAVNKALSKMSGPSGYYSGTGATYYYPVGPATAPSSSGAPTAGGWKTSPKGKWYEQPDGTYVCNQWKQVDGKWYYFDAEGYLVTNKWIKDTYYVTSTGEMAVNTWVDGKYYVDANGAWVKNPKQPAPVSGGWQKDSTGWWYRNSDGSYPTSCWRWIDGNGVICP